MVPPTSTIMRSRVETLRPRNEDRKDIAAVTCFDVLGGKMSLATEKRETRECSMCGREGGTPVEVHHRVGKRERRWDLPDSQPRIRAAHQIDATHPTYGIFA